MTSLDYWAECLSNSLEEHGVIVAADKVSSIAADIESAHENYGMAFYTPTESPYKAELEQVKKALKVEREKILCETCGGSGGITSYGPSHSAYSSCWKCNGEGRRTR